MKNPKLIDEAWIDEQIQYVGTPNNKYDDALLHVMNLVKSKLQPLPTPTKTNVDKIRAGEMAIENDDSKALQVCLDYFLPHKKVIADEGIQFYHIHEDNWYWWYETDLPTIKASELIKEIKGVTEPEAEAEWQPKFGDKITVNLCGEMIDAVCVGDKEGAIYWKSEINFNKDEFGVQNIKYVKPRTPTLTLAEAEAKLGVKIVI